ncbi:MAG: hypothetical protein R6U98_30480 [Pirellulaceae bacterium]
MLKTMVSVVGAEQKVHFQIHDGLADVGVAALSAQPMTKDEWLTAMGRFVDPSVVEHVEGQCRPGLGESVMEGGHVIIDLTARLLVMDTPLPDMPRLGNVQSCTENELLDDWLPYRIPEEWEITETAEGWEQRARERRGRWAEIDCVDCRGVLYGKLPGWIVEQWRRNADQLDEPTRQLQESWLLTPREDLQQKTPREVLLADRAFIDGDIQDQGRIWGLTGRCPPRLPVDSHAYCHGGFGSHEIILYHEMTSQLLVEYERRLGTDHAGDPREHVRHLEQLQQEWMHQPHQVLYDQSPAAMIARERSRLPAVIPESHAVEHDDCPLCRMMHDSGQPMIWQLDNFSLDHCFATSFYDTFEQWQLVQQEWEAMRRDVEPDQGGRKSEDNGKDQEHEHETERETENEARVWQRSHTNMQFFEDMPPLEACGVMLFSIGGHMAELIHDLKSDEAAVDHCRELHECFDDLRVVFREQEDVWMIQSATAAFSQALQTVTRLRPDLAAKCADLDEKLEFLHARYAEHFDPYSPPA